MKCITLSNVVVKYKSSYAATISSSTSLCNFFFIARSWRSNRRHGLAKHDLKVKEQQGFRLKAEIYILIENVTWLVEPCTPRSSPLVYSVEFHAKNNFYITGGDHLDWPSAIHIGLSFENGPVLFGLLRSGLDHTLESSTSMTLDSASDWFIRDRSLCRRENASGFVTPERDAFDESYRHPITSEQRTSLRRTICTST